MTSKKILVVLGATGNQGGSVIDTILSDITLSKEFDIRAVTRDPTKLNAAALATRGVSLFKVCLTRITGLWILIYTGRSRR